MLAIGGSDSNGALFSFTFAAVFLLTVLCMFHYATRQEFYQYYSTVVKFDSEDSEDDGAVNVRKVIRSTWTFNVAVFLNFFVTLGVFPSYFR